MMVLYTALNIAFRAPGLPDAFRSYIMHLDDESAVAWVQFAESPKSREGVAEYAVQKLLYEGSYLYMFYNFVCLMLMISTHHILRETDRMVALAEDIQKGRIVDVRTMDTIRRLLHSHENLFPVGKEAAHKTKVAHAYLERVKQLYDQEHENGVAEGAGSGAAEETDGLLLSDGGPVVASPRLADSQGDKRKALTPSEKAHHRARGLSTKSQR